MKRMTRTMLAFGVAAVAAFACACAQPPTDEIASLDQTLQSARDAEAAVYAPEQWAAAQAANDAVAAELTTQRAKIAVLRSYAKAEELLAKASEAARAAEGAGTAAREQARAEAETAVAQVKSDIESAQTLLAELEACPRKPKGFAEDLELLNSDLLDLQRSVSEAEGMYNESGFRDASALASSLGAEIGAFVEELTNARLKIKC